MNLKKIVIVFFFFLSILSYSQENKIAAIDVVKKASNMYLKKEYMSFTTQYSLYLDYTTSKVYESYNGLMLKKNNVTYFKIKNTEFASFDDYAIKVNHDQKAIVIEKNKSEKTSNPFSIDIFLKGFNAKFLDSKGDYYVCQLTPAGKFSSVMFHKVILYVKKTDYSVSKQIMYFVEKMQSKNTSGKVISSVPRLEISFKARVADDKKDNVLIDKETYYNSLGDKIVVSKKLATYKLFKS